MEIMKILGSLFEGTMSTLFHEPFISEFVDYVCPTLNEINIWMRIVKQRGAAHMHKIVQKLQPKYAVFNCTNGGGVKYVERQENQHRLCFVFVVIVWSGGVEGAKPPYNMDGETLPNSRRLGCHQIPLQWGQICKISCDLDCEWNSTYGWWRLWQGKRTTSSMFLREPNLSI